jgi:formiminotetrahydrofolate cyclodeaminase
MMPYSEMALVDLLDAFASNEPVPGGGSAAALAGSLGVSLLIMVAGLPKTRKDSPEEAADLSEASARLRPLRDALTTLIDDDSAAYSAVLEAMRLPKETGEQTTARRQAVGAAMQRATEVPLDTMRHCQQALRGAIVIARSGNRNAATDTATAVELLRAGLRSAGMNVDVNLPGLTDAELAARVRTERNELVEEGESDARQAVEAALEPA